MSDTDQKEGWGFPALSRKAHYFVGTTSLCGRWMFAGEIDKQALGTKAQKDDCVECWRKQKKREDGA